MLAVNVSVRAPKFRATPDDPLDDEVLDPLEEPLCALPLLLPALLLELFELVVIGPTVVTAEFEVWEDVEF